MTDLPFTNTDPRREFVATMRAGGHELPRPPCDFTDKTPARRVMLAMETFARHMTDEGWQLQLGLEQAGYELWGPKFPNDEADVGHILETTDPVTVVMQDKREWDPAKLGCFDKTVAFQRSECLADRPGIFRVTICKDAHHDPVYHEQAHQEIGTHAWIHYYHPAIVQALAPWIRPADMIRTWHSVDRNIVPPYSPAERAGAFFSGALAKQFYPLRHRIVEAIGKGQLPQVHHEPHPGYNADGHKTPEFLQTLSRYKVIVATTSVFGYVLRKLIEGTACGCVVVTDLPAGETLPEIDGNLVRVPHTIKIDDLREVIRRAEVDYDPERQAHFAPLAQGFYDYRRLGQRMARQIEAARVGQRLASLVTVHPSPGIVSREQFGSLLNMRGLAGNAVEIGTYCGDFAKTLLATWPGILYCVDPWSADAPDYPARYADGTPTVGPDGRQFIGTNWAEILHVARHNLAPYGERAKLVQATSREAFRQLQALAFEFVYIDGNHMREYVAEDIEMWWDRINPGGILAGHDWNGEWEPEVRPAVLAHAQKWRLPVYYVLGPAASWYMVKPA